MQKLKRVLALLLAVSMLLAFNACSVNDYATNARGWLLNAREELINKILSVLPRSQNWDEPPTEPLQETISSAKEIKAPPSRHYYERLQPRQQHAYLAIAQQMPSFPERIEIPPLDKDALAEVVRAYSYDNPGQFNLGDSYALVSQGTKYYFQPSYRYNQESYYSAEAKLQAAIKDIVKIVSASLDDYGKELVLHNLLMSRVEYQSDGMEYESTAYGSLVLGKASCEGYSRAMKLLLEKLGIESVLATGNATSSAGKTEAHMWNIVKIDGQWYHLDPTWNDIEGEEWRYDYFNLSDREISLSHDINTDGFISCQSTQANYFRKENLFFESYDSFAKDRISEALKDKVRAGDYYLELRFANKELLEYAQEKLTNSKDGEIYRMLETAALSSPKPIVTNEIRYHYNDKLSTIRFTLSLKF